MLGFLTVVLGQILLGQRLNRTGASRARTAVFYSLGRFVCLRIGVV